jgi:glycosyltransferase involved in cell wall biosynthesis
VTPRDVRRRIAIVTHSYFEEDPRIRREAEALIGAGWSVDVFALRRPDDARTGELGGASVTRLDVGRHQGASLPVYLWEYLSFLLRAGWALTRAHRRRRYTVIQVAAPPDPLVLAALPARLAGVPVILDLHEATPEFFRSRFPGAINRVTDGVLHLAERLSIELADLALSVNDARRERLLRLGYPARKLAVVTNGPSLARFRPEAHPSRPFMADGSLRLIYAGALTPLYELDVVLRAMARMHEERPGVRVVFDVYGRGDAEARLQSLAETLGLADRVTFHGRVPLDDVAAAIAAADIGLSPMRRDSFTEISLPTKILEYAAMNKPVIAADLPTARSEFPGTSLAWYSPGDAEGMAAAIGRLIDDETYRETSRQSAAERARELSWDQEAPRYVRLVEAAARGRR